jgi:hypothetical protein
VTQEVSKLFQIISDEFKMEAIPWLSSVVILGEKIQLNISSRGAEKI